MCGSFPGLLIGRTAVHSGKDPAFVAYDQFLSTGILQPLSRGEVRGSFASILPCPLSCPLSPLPDSAVQQTAAIRSPRRRAAKLGVGISPNRATCKSTAVRSSTKGVLIVT